MLEGETTRSDGEKQQCPLMMNGANVDVRQFHVLDEINNDSDSRMSGSCESDDSDDVIERLLDEALERKKRTAKEAGLGPYPY